MTIDNRVVQGGSAAPVYVVNSMLDVVTEPGGQVISVPYNVAVARGTVPGVISDRKFGRAPGADTTYRTLWDGNTAVSYGGFNATPSTVSVVSSSPNDTSGGSGARTIRIQGLDASFNLQSEDFTLNGVTPVAGALTFSRVFRAFALTGGASETNEGTITGTMSGVTMFAIQNGYGQTSMAVYTVPLGYTLELLQVDASVGANKTAQYLLETRAYQSSIWRVRQSWEITNAAYTPADRSAPLELPERTDIRIRGKVSSGTGEINAAFGFYLLAS